MLVLLKLLLVAAIAYAGWQVYTHAEPSAPVRPASMTVDPR